MDFATFFRSVSGNAPYDYQSRLACGPADGRSDEFWLGDSAPCQSQLISIPTGLGKTAAVVLAWLWNRVVKENQNWPRRLVYCLPMRTLVEQTAEETKKWIANLLAQESLGLSEDAKSQLAWLKDHSPIILMGGEDPGEWDIYPEKPAILIGTQDMLLSRALNRGYGMSRYRWPMHFGLLNNDCLWVMDETQLMGPGLWTSGQLDWMRNHRFGVTMPCLTWWMSATNSPVFLDTPDRRKHRLTDLPVINVGHDPSALTRLQPCRPLSFWKGHALKPKSDKKGTSAPGFSDGLSLAIRAEHVPGTLTLVVCNSVGVAQELFRQLGDENVILLTSRFRRSDRDKYTKQLLAFEQQRKAQNKEKDDDTLPDSPGLICISTQVIEAGVDVSARRLWLEAAPWPSVLQRLGRLNRDGRANGKAKALVFQWPDQGKKTKGQQVGPYEAKEIETSVKLICKLAAIYEEEATIGAKAAIEKLHLSYGAEIETALKPKNEPFPRAMHVHGLFSTEPDLFGGFTDISAWVRGEDKNADVTVFWREFEAKKGPGKSATLTGPAFDPKEACSVAIHRFRDLLGDNGRTLVWDERIEEWQSTKLGEICPGMVLMLPRMAGGYSENLGWTGKANDKLSNLPPPGPFSSTYEEDVASEQAGWVTLESHLADTKAAAERIADELQIVDQLRTAIVTAAEWHDIGKSHHIWQSALPLSPAAVSSQFWAKAPFVFVLSGKDTADLKESTRQLIETAGIKSRFFREETKGKIQRQLWTVSEKIRDTHLRGLLSEITSQAAGLECWMRRFLPRPSLDKPCIRHEAASALAVWTRYFNNSTKWPGLTIYLVACHHGKVRTALYARGDDGGDVCGVPKEQTSLPWENGMPMDFSCASVGAEGEFSEDGSTFTVASPGWTALIADLLGGWEQRPENAAAPIALRDGTEPRLLGPFALAYLESLICASDIQASKKPSELLHV